VSPFGPSRACEHTLRCASLGRCVSARCACVRVCAAVYVFDRSAHLALPLLALVVSLEWSAACTECGMCGKGLRLALVCFAPSLPSMDSLRAWYACRCEMLCEMCGKQV
jgi:hypothetical protein